MSIAAAEDDEVSVRAYTPGGTGMHLRTPALLPYGVQLRGRYVAHGAFDVCKPLPQAVTGRELKVHTNRGRHYA